MPFYTPWAETRSLDSNESEAASEVLQLQGQ